MPFVVAATFKIKKKYLAEFNKRVRKHANNCVTKEAGCISFEVSTDNTDPRRFLLYEVYVDESDFEAHMEAAHVKRHLGATDAWIDGKGELIGLMSRLSAPNK
jgi:quinol monooxygenase YgiN